MHHEEVDEAANDLLIPVLGVGRLSGGEGVCAAGCIKQDLDDRIQHGCSDSNGDGVEVVSYPMPW